MRTMKVTEKERERILISRIKNGKYKRKPKRKKIKARILIGKQLKNGDLIRIQRLVQEQR